MIYFTYAVRNANNEINAYGGQYDTPAQAQAAINADLIKAPVGTRAIMVECGEIETEFSVSKVVAPMEIKSKSL